MAHSLRRAMTRKVINAAIARTRMRSVLLALVGLPILAMVAALSYFTYRESEADIEGAYQVAAALNESTATQSEEFLRRAENGLSAASRRPQVQGLDPDNCDPLLAAWKGVQPAYANIFTLDASGRLVCSAMPIAAGTAAGPDPRYYFAETMRTGKFTVGKPAKGFVTGRWVSTLAYPILNVDGQPIGVIGAAVDLATYTPLVTHGHLPPSTVVGIVNSEGTIIARSEDQQRVGSGSNSEATRIILKQKEGRIRSREYRGIDRFFVFTPIGRSDWIAWVSVDAATVLAPARRAALQRLGIALALIVAIAALTIHVARRIANPIEAISNTLAAMRRGELHSRAPISGPMETQEIAVELNSMLDDLKQAEESSQRALQRLTEAQRIGQMGDWDLDLSTGAITWSQQIYLILGRDPSLGPPKNCEENAALFEPGSAALVAAKVAAAIASGDAQEQELVAACLDGRRVPVYATAVPRKDRDGKVVGLNGTVQDVSARTKAERLVRESEERLSFATEAAQIGDWDMDLRTNVARRSLRHDQCFGYTEMLPAWGYDTFLAHIEPADRDRVAAGFQKAMAGMGQYDEEFRAPWPDGSVHWLWSRGRFYFDETGQPYRVAGIVVDVSQHKQAQLEIAKLNGELVQRVHERTEQLEQLRDLTRRLNEHAEIERRNISRELHDRVGPNLVALQLNLDMMQATLPPDASNKRTLIDAREVLEQTIVHVRDVMSDLRPPALDDYGLLAALRSYAQRYAARLDAEVEVQGTDIKPRPSLAVETGLFRIAQEALNNIAKHACAQRVLIAAERTLTGITLAITDDGVGFDCEVERKSGGIGLDTMRERAEALGAALRIESRPGGPTSVVVELACGAA